MPDYSRARAAFSWDRAAEELDWLPGGALNIAHEAVDRHASGPLADTPALRLIARDGQARELTYAELRRQSDRFANVLAGLGVGRGERVFVLAGRIGELLLGDVALQAGSGQPFAELGEHRVIRAQLIDPHEAYFLELDNGTGLLRSLYHASYLATILEVAP